MTNTWKKYVDDEKEIVELRLAQRVKDALDREEARYIETPTCIILKNKHSERYLIKINKNQRK